MSVEFNVRTPWTNAGIHCRTSSSVDCIGEDKLTLLSSLYDGSNGFSFPREKYKTLTRVFTVLNVKLFDRAHSNNSFSL